MGRRYNVEGTKTFLAWAIGLLVLGLWCVKDGWFPAASVLERHPLDRDTAFYVFNKSLAVMTLVGSVVCGYIHLVVK